MFNLRRRIHHERLGLITNKTHAQRPSRPDDPCFGMTFRGRFLAGPVARKVNSSRLFPYRMIKISGSYVCSYVMHYGCICSIQG